MSLEGTGGKLPVLSFLPANGARAARRGGYDRPRMAPPIRLTLEQFYAFSASDRLSIRRYGQRTEQVDVDVTLGAGAVGRLLSFDSDRIQYALSNSGTSNAAAIGEANTVTAATGIILGANGGGVVRDALTDGSVVGRELWGFSTGGTTISGVITRVTGQVYVLPPEVGPLS